MKILDEIRAIIAVLFFLVASLLFVPALIIYVIGTMILTQEDRDSISKSINGATVKIKSLK